MKYLFFPILFCILFSFCKKTEPKSVQILDCYIRYLEQERQLKAEIALKSGNDEKSALPKEVPGGIRYNGTLLALKPTQGMTYKTELEGFYTGNNAITWKNKEGNTLTCRIPMESISDISVEGNTVKKNQTNTISWKGAPMDKDEKFVFMWESATHGTAPMEVTGTTGENSIDFPAAELGKLQSGKWTLYIVRKKIIRDEVSGIMVKGVSEYFSGTKEIEVK